jgi:hypothetical protein
MGWGNEDMDRTPSPRAAKINNYNPPVIPLFPPGEASAVFDGVEQDAEELTAIQSLHDLYNRNLPELRTAFEGRERVRTLLGGKVKFKWLTALGQPEFEIPVIPGRDVHVTGFVMPGGANQIKATKWFKRAKEIYSAIGVNLVYDFKELLEVPDGVDLTDGFDIPSETIPEHLIEMRPETIALMSILTNNDNYKLAPDTIPVFFVSAFAGQRVSNVPSLMAAGSESYGGAIFIDSSHEQVSALAHELAHILLDAGHQPSPRALWNNDFTGKKCYVWWGDISPAHGSWTDSGIIAHRRFRDSMRSRILKSKYVKP